MKRSYMFHQFFGKYIVVSFITIALFAVWPTAGLAVDRVDLSGTVTYNGQAVTAMVLANGKYMFTGGAQAGLNKGDFQLQDVPLDSSGRIVLYVFCSGLSPYVEFLDGLTDGQSVTGHDIVLTADGGQQPVVAITSATESATKTGWMDISGMITSPEGAPLTAMALANGQYMFTGGTQAGLEKGEFSLTVPIDANGRITLYGFCSGYMPYQTTLNGSTLVIESEIDNLFAMADDVSDLTPLLDEVLIVLLAALDPSSAPAGLPLTVEPELDLEEVLEGNIPTEDIVATLDYGTGYTGASGALMTGSMTMTISNLTIQEGPPLIITVDVNVDADNLMADDDLIMDGEVDLEVDVEVSEALVADAAITVTLTSVQTLLSAFNGSIGLDISDLDLQAILLGGTLDIPITVTFTNFTTDNYSVSGTIALTMDDATTFSVDVNLTTNEGTIDGVMTITTDEDMEVMTVNSQGSMDFMGYEVTITNVVYNTNTCEDYPISGTVDIDDTTLSFAGDCSGYTIQ